MNTTTSHGDLPESFAPETVDDEIARYLSTEPQPVESAGDALLIRELAAYHALPPEASASLARARMRLRTSIQSLDGDGDSRRRGDASVDTRSPHSRSLRQVRATATSQPSQARLHLTSLATPLRAVAAVLVVALLVGSFVAVLHLRAGRQTAAAPTWQNVAITQEKVHGYQLDFVPAQVDVEYAVSDVDGTIYAYPSGSSNVWYSMDGGATYQPFTLSLPRSSGDQPYTVSTVPGLRGVFLSGTTGAKRFMIIYYAELGDKSWRHLSISNLAQPLTQNGSRVTFIATDIGQAIFSEHESGNTVQARAVGNWLFLLAKRTDSSEPMLIGTPDLGANWYALSSTLPGTCAQFAVNPADARQLFCLMSDHIVEQTADGGLTWNQMVSVHGDTMSVNGHANGLYQSIWASRRAVYDYTWITTGQTTLSRHPIGAGDWVAAAPLPMLPPGGPEAIGVSGGGSEVVGVSPDDTVYAASALPGSPMRVRISALAPGAQQFTPIGNDATLTPPTSAIFFDLGGIYSGKTPAIFAQVAQWDVHTSPRPLYRLALQATGTPPFLTPTTLPTITPTLHAACTNAPGDVANIQSGGYGADLDTFPQRWGPSDGAAAGSAYFGRWPDGTAKVQVGIVDLPSNHRVNDMTYFVNKAQNMTQAQGEAFATSILPKDAVQVGRSQERVGIITVTYCSAAILAVFPVTVRDIDGPLPHNGLIAVTYAQRNPGAQPPDDYLYGIGFKSLP